MQLVKPDYHKVFRDSYQKLNAAQREAVDAIDGPIMVIAGPGTGKTQILAMRIANLLQNPDLQLDPSNILCLTFTETAVSAMRNRLISIIGNEAYYVRVHTFHSFCNEVIKDNPHYFNVVSSISDLEQIQILNEIIDKLEPGSPIKPYGDNYYYRSILKSIISELKKESISPDELEAKIFDVENFLEKNLEQIEGLLSVHGAKLKDKDCEDFIERLSIRNLDSRFISLFRDYWSRSERPSEFKKLVKAFVDDNQKNIPKQKELVKVYREYKKIFAERKIYDYDDMILQVIEKFAEEKDLLSSYQELFQYILVDEYQDTNGAQNKILDLLLSYYQQNPNIFVVGDDDQCVFRFQGASIENIVHFHSRYESIIKLIVLDKNYRSQQNILDLARYSISNNSNRIDKLVCNITKELSSEGEARNFEKLSIEIHKCLNEKDEIYHLAKTVQALIDTGTQPREIAVIYRENSEAGDLEDAFARLGIAFKVEAGENALENLHIAQLIDLLKVIDNPRSSLLYNVLNYDFIHHSSFFKEAEISHLDIFRIFANRSRENQKPLIEILLEDNKFRDFANALCKMREESFNYRFDYFLERVVKVFGYGEYIFKLDNYIFEINYLDSLFTEVKSLIENKNYISNKKTNQTLKRFELDDFIKYVELLQENDLKIKVQALNYDPNSVRLMTAHKSKGLEFEQVFVLSCVDKHWGNKSKRDYLKFPPFLLNETQSLVTGDKNEDDRRLFFVALTRAKKNIYLFYYSRNQKDQEVVPSIFINELLTCPGSLIKNQDHLEQNLELERLQLSIIPKIDQSIEFEQAYIDSLLQNYKMSVTHLNNFLQCKRKFFYKNLLRVPAAKDKSSSLGTAIHNALFDLFADTEIQAGQDLDQARSFIAERFETHLLDEGLPENQFNETLFVGKKILNEYIGEYFGKFNLEVMPEYDFSGKGLNFEGLELTGKLDKIEIIDGQQINVVDYKTGDPGNARDKLKPGGDYHRQIVFYQLLCDLAKARAEFKYEMVSGEIDFVRKDSYSEKFKKEKIIVSTEDLDLLKTEIQEMRASIYAHDFEKTSDLKLCVDCEFKNVCGRI